MSTTTIILVDDHQLIRAGLRMLLENLSDIEVIAEFSLGKDAIAGITALEPDIVLLDISLPDISGLEVLASVNALDWSGKTPPRILMLSMHGQKEYVVRAIRAGAAGYLLKESAPEEMEAALNALIAGEQWLSPSLREQMTGRRIIRQKHLIAGAQLSPRQLEVLLMIAHGACTKEIASTLELSAKTIESYRAQIMEKLDIHDIASLVLYAVRQGLITP
jgi:DNA-binding NarL/FixJ family response regulator